MIALIFTDNDVDIPYETVQQTTGKQADLSSFRRPIPMQKTSAAQQSLRKTLYTRGIDRIRFGYPFQVQKHCWFQSVKRILTIRMHVNESFVPDFLFIRVRD